MSEEKIEKTEDAEPKSTAKKLMAEGRADKTEKVDPKSPVKKKVKGSNRIARWFREMRSELKKVVWPTPKQIVNNTFVAVTVMAVAAVAIWAIDYAGSQIFQAIRLLTRG